MRKVMINLWQNMWIVVFAGFFVFAIFTIWGGIPDSDTYFLAATGRYIVETGTVPTINPFVIHENFGIIVQQWLFDVIVYGIYNTFGNLGLFFFIFAFFFITMVLLYRYFGLFTENKIAKNIVLLTSGIIYLYFSTARPTVFSFLVMLLLLYCVEQYKRSGKPTYLIVLPFLSLLQVNIHAAMWPMMFVLLLPYIFPFWLLQKGSIQEHFKAWYAGNKKILLATALMFAAGFLNPNGLNGMTYVLKSYGSATSGVKIAELQPPTTDSIYGFYILATIAFLAVYVYKNKDRLLDPSADKREEFTRLSMACGVLILSCTHNRNIWYVILGAMPIVLQVLSPCSFRRQKEEISYTTYELFIRNVTFVLSIVIVAFFMSAPDDSGISTIEDGTVAPIAAADYLDEAAREDIVLYTEFNNGAYMEWRGYKVYIDARPELFQAKINGQEDIYTEYCNVKNGSIEYGEFLSKYGFTHLIVSEGTLLDVFLSLNPAYKVVVVGNGYKLYQSK